MKQKAFFMTALVFAAVFFVAMGAAFAAGESQKERYIVKMNAGEHMDAAAMPKGTEKIGDLNLIGAVVVNADSSELDNLKKLAGVAYVEKDVRVQALDVIPWGISRVSAPAVWASGNTGSGIKVAVLDTGVDYTHPDLSGVYAGGITYVSGTLTPMDDNGHGSHVSGTVAAAYNGIGLVGVAPGINLYGVKVLNSAGSGYVSDIIKGLDWAISNNMDVVSMSFGTSSYIASLDDAIQRAYSAGIVLVAAAGNSGLGADKVNYPAKFPQVIAVAATDSSNNRVYFSSTGPAVSLSAPGVSINSTVPGNSYALYSGTSMAAPHVSGVAALLLSTAIPSAYDLNSNGAWDPVEVRNRLQDTATDLGAAGKDNYYGYGLVNASAAVAASAPVPPAPFDYSLSVSPPSGSAEQGSAASASVILSLTSGSAEEVSLSCSNLPYGASCNFAPAALYPTGNSVMTVSTASATPLGTYNVSINGLGGAVSRSAAYVLAVTAPPAPIVTYNATFVAQGIAPGIIWGVTVAGNRHTTSGSSIVVTNLSGSQEYSYDSIVNGTTGTRFPCGTGCSGSIGAHADVSAAYNTQHLLTMSSNPAYGGTTNPAAGTYWQDSGASVPISASSAPGYAFVSWSGTGNGSVSGTSGTATVTMNSPVFETANFEATVSGPDYFSDDFESGASGWVVSGLWHKTTKRSASPSNSFWYGDEKTNSYRTGRSKNFGALTSQPIDLAGAVSPQLAFMSWYRTESGTAYDKKLVQVSADGGNTWNAVMQISDARSVWNPETVSLAAYAGRTILLRFYFDTIDGYSNSYEGWYVDDVKISEASSSSASPQRPVRARAQGTVAGMPGE